MFDNIGSKIKTLAKVVCWIGIIGSVIAAIICFATGEEDLIGYGIGLLIGGPLASWIGSFLTYGFGELIEKATEIEINTRINPKNTVNAAGNPISASKAPTQAIASEAQVKKNINLKPLSKDCEINKTYSFGEYWQESSAENMKTAIEWIVLDKKDNKALVISRFALDVQPFSEDPQATTWGNCSLRAWLNSTFVKNAFSEKEQAKIEMTTVSLDKNPKIDASSESDTKDRIFLLSTTEIKKYLLASNRQCFASSYAQKHGAYANPSNGFCWWWLRTSGDDQDRAMIVISNDGSINYHGNYVYNKNGAVRPAMWINLGE